MFTQIVASTAKIEYYPWMSPVPAITEFKGHRNYGTVESVIYAIRNLPYANGFVVPLDEVEDEAFNVHGYMHKPRELALRARKFPGRAVLKNIGTSILAGANSAAGTSVTFSNGSPGSSINAFDGLSIFATRTDGTSGAIGTGTNFTTNFATNDSKSGSSTSANNYNMVFMYSGDILKPMIWQNRLAPRLLTNAGTPQSFESKQLRYWCDMRGAAAFGWWWHSYWFQFLGLPNITEMLQAFSTIIGAMRGFILPRAIVTDDGEYVHEQTDFKADNTAIAGSISLEPLLRQALNESWIPQAGSMGPVGGSATGAGTVVSTPNPFVGLASFTVSAFLQ
jgi:phage major head subunit gpT-like protein